ncbi:hypothetical protein [Ruminococcus sp.]|uniref:hypothetical protein n=1 Tax=Ruminococcus sp. TaxID=41978 RepID=UPI00388E9FD0
MIKLAPSVPVFCSIVFMNHFLKTKKSAPLEDQIIISLIPPPGRFLLPKNGCRLPFEVSFVL